MKFQSVIETFTLRKKLFGGPEETLAHLYCEFGHGHILCNSIIYILNIAWPDTHSDFVK